MTKFPELSKLLSVGGRISGSFTDQSEPTELIFKSIQPAAFRPYAINSDAAERYLKAFYYRGSEKDLREILSSPQKVKDFFNEYKEFQENEKGSNSLFGKGKALVIDLKNGSHQALLRIVSAVETLNDYFRALTGSDRK